MQANAYYTPAQRPGLRGSPRHARRLLPPGRGREALARLPARPRAAAEKPELRPGDGRARRARARRHHAGRRHALPPARLAPPGDDLGRGFAAPDRRRQRLRPGATQCARRSTRRRARTSSSGGAYRPTGRRRRSCSSCSRARLAPEAVSARRRRSFVETRRPIRDDAFDQLRALDDLDLETPLERRGTVIADLSAATTRQRLVVRRARLAFPALRRATTSSSCSRSDEPFRAERPARPARRRGPSRARAPARPRRFAAHQARS